jgi:D-ribose pyranose/furanose isomerase RbsD
MKKSLALLAFIVMLVAGCVQKNTTATDKTTDWKSKLETTIDTFGHRNWILVVDKAFPSLSSPNIEVVFADVDIPTALDTTIKMLENATHVKPIIYIDKEFAYISENELEGITEFRTKAHASIHSFNPKQLYHEEVFNKVKEVSSLFKVLVIKTNETTPYSSVFIELDCKYWSGEQEEALRKAMQATIMR